MSGDTRYMISTHHKIYVFEVKGIVPLDGGIGVP